MGMRMPEGAQPGQGGGGGAAELVANVSKGLESIAQMVGSQFGEEAGMAIMDLQQQFQQVMMQIGKQGQGAPQAGPQAAPGDQAGVAQAEPAGNPAMRQ